MEKFEKDKKNVEVPIIVCKNCKDKEDTPLIYPTRQKDEYLIFCLKCGNYEVVSGRDIGVKNQNE